MNLTKTALIIWSTYRIYDVVLLSYHAIGRVCVPISLSEVDDFDPFNVPTVSQLCHEFEARNEGKKGKILLPYYFVYSNFGNFRRRRVIISFFKCSYGTNFNYLFL